MSRYAAPIEDTLGKEIYDRYVTYCVKKKAIPDPFVFWRVSLVRVDKYPISKSGFAFWLMRLQIPPEPGMMPYIWRDTETGAWRLRDVEVSRA